MSNKQKAPGTYVLGAWIYESTGAGEETLTLDLFLGKDDKLTEVESPQEDSRI